MRLFLDGMAAVIVGPPIRLGMGSPRRPTGATHQPSNASSHQSIRLSESSLPNPRIATSVTRCCTFGRQSSRELIEGVAMPELPHEQAGGLAGVPAVDRSCVTAFAAYPWLICSDGRFTAAAARVDGV